MSGLQGELEKLNSKQIDQVNKLITNAMASGDWFVTDEGSMVREGSDEYVAAELAEDALAKAAIEPFVDEEGGLERDTENMDPEEKVVEKAPVKKKTDK